MALADNILSETPDALCLFGEAGAISPADRCRIGVDMSPDQLLALLPKGCSRPTIVFTGSDAEEQLKAMSGQENLLKEQAEQYAKEKGIKLYWFDADNYGCIGVCISDCISIGYVFLLVPCPIGGKYI